MFPWFTHFSDIFNHDRYWRHIRPFPQWRGGWNRKRRQYKAAKRSGRKGGK